MREIIRKVSVDDAEAIAGIYKPYVEQTTVSFEVVAPDVEQMRSRIEHISRDWPYYVCEIDGRIVGYAYVHLWKERPAYGKTLETTIYLSADAKGMGIGKRLMNKVIDDCKELSVHTLIACITAENVDSIEFHRRLGFSKVSLFKHVGRKFGRWLDVVDMQLML